MCKADQKSSSHSESRIGSEMPVELLMEIFTLSTAVPDSLHQPQLVAREDDTYAIPEPAKRRYRESLTTKHVLTQVCRLWNKLATRMLYEHVLVENQRQLDALVATLDRSHPSNNAQGSSPSPGPLVQRLDALLSGVPLIFETHDYDTDVSGVRRLNLLRRAIGFMPNLWTLILDGVDDETIDEEHQFTLAFLPPTIRFLSIWDYFMYSPSEILDLLDKQPSLAVLDCPRHIVWRQNAFRNALEHAKSSTKVFPQVKELVYRIHWLFFHFFNRLPATIFRNLQKVVMHHPPRMEYLREFLSVHGRHLTSIHMRLEPGRVAKRHLVYQWFEILQDTCPNLRDFSLTNYDEDTTSTLPLQTLRGVTTFGIQRWYPAKEGRDPAGLVRELIADAVFFAPSFPHLHTVRLMDEENVSALQDPSIGGAQFEAFLMDCRSRKLNVVDHFGVCLN